MVAYASDSCPVHVALCVDQVRCYNTYKPTCCYESYGGRKNFNSSFQYLTSLNLYGAPVPGNSKIDRSYNVKHPD